MSKKRSSSTTETVGDTFSEDEDNVYLNAAKSFRVLKQNVPTVISSDEESDGYHKKTPLPPRKTTARVIGTNTILPKRTRSQTKRQNAARLLASKKQNAVVHVNSVIDTIVLDNIETTPNKPNNYDKIIINDDDKDDVIVLGDDSILSDDDNYEVSIKVKWRSRNIHRISMGKHEPFISVFNYFAKLDGIAHEQILITQGTRVILDTDTPASLNLSVIDILDGGVVNKDWTIQTSDNTQKKAKETDKNICNIKVQMANSKHPLIIEFRKNQSFIELYKKCAKQLSTRENEIKLFFDGEQVDPSDTPESLDLEDEACFDLRISKSAET